MTIQAGTKLGRYEIRSLLGAGGMGEVYRARDEKLNRDVAIKVLPVEFSQDAERLRRFEQEAQAASALNHPNILSVYDFGEHDGAPYVVSELLEGETLRDKLNGASVSQRKAIDYASQIARGLAAAHARGIVHRDLKPENVFITADGHLRIIDFGLAKLIEPMSAEAQTDVPTRRVNTDPGTVMGTVGYMSPEQVRGRTADHRSDIFSFGAVLYEMLSGKRAFRGESAVDTLSAILKEDPPDLSTTNSNVAPALERIVHHCLEKNPEERFQSARDLAFDLETLSGTSGAPVMSASDVAITPEPTRRTWRRERFGWMAVVVLSLIIGTVARLLPPRATAVPARAVRFAISLKAGQTLGGSWWWSPSVAVSPDGSRIAYVATDQNGVSELYMRALGDLSVTPIAGTALAHTPFFSPDSQWLGFMAGAKLQKVPVAGGPPVTITSVPKGDLRGAYWGNDDAIVFGAAGDALMTVPASGGTPRALVTRKGGEQNLAWPQILPGGKALLFALRAYDEPSFDDAEIVALSLATGERRTLIKGGTDARFVSTGHLLWMKAGVLMAAGFDPVGLRLTSTPAPILEHVFENPRTGAGQFSVSADGSLVYIPGGASYGDHELVWVDRSGATRPVTDTIRPYEDFTLSPDGRFIAATIEGPVTDTWIIDINRNTQTRLTDGPENRDPVWTPDGKEIVNWSHKEGVSGVFLRSSDGSGTAVRLTPPEGDPYALSWSPDGQTLLIGETAVATGDDVWMLSIKDGTMRPLLQSRFNETWAGISPDGHWLAYASNESGRSEVYVAAFPGPGGKQRISTDGGLHPLWAPNGRELFYLSGPSPESMAFRALAQRVRLIAVPLETTPTFAAGAPHVLFEGPYFESDHDFAVAPDGQHFVMIRERRSESDPTELHVVLNWFDELKRLVPTK